MHYMDRLKSKEQKVSGVAAYPGVAANDFGQQKLDMSDPGAPDSSPSSRLLTLGTPGPACMANDEYQIVTTALEYANEFELLPKLVIWPF